MAQFVEIKQDFLALRVANDKPKPIAGWLAEGQAGAPNPSQEDKASSKIPPS